MERVKVIGTFVWTCVFLVLPFDISVFEWKSNVLNLIWRSILSSYPFDFGKDVLLYSDSAALVVAFIISVIFFSALAFALRKSKFFNLDKYTNPVIRVFDLCMVIVFVKYGVDKVMMLQFPPPEINLLHTPLGEFDKDILFWSTMGSSVLFNYLLGGIEILGAIALLFPRNNLFGRHLLLLSCLAIFTINISFGIGVKLFSGFLLIGLIFRSIPSLKFLWTYFFSFEEDGRQKGWRKKTLTFSFRAIMGLSLLMLTIFENERQCPISKDWIGAYQRIDGEEELYINSLDYWISRPANGEQVTAKITSGKNGLFHLETAEKSTIVRLEDHSNYLHVTNFGNSTWQTYKKVKLYE